MKQTLLIITALMLVFGCGSSEKEPEKDTSSSQAREPIDGSTLVWKDGKPYAPASDKPYSGVAVRYHENGQKSDERTYKDGKQVGKSTWWYENGQKKHEGTYKDGERDGKWTEWYENGQKKGEGTYKNGERDGKSTWWYENGQKKHEVTHKDGEDVTNFMWYENGQKMFEWTYKDGSLISSKCWDVVGYEIDCSELDF
jgi:antitoxin component YwqK of YwqJK toxin-antitoxin module